METSLFVGRFQPLHLGHVAAIEYALSKSDRLVIAVGSAEKSYELRNPFTAGERIEMLYSVLASKKLLERVVTITVPDVDNHLLWVPLVRSLAPSFSRVFSNDPLTILLFRNEGYAVEEVPLYRREELMATEVRRRMAEGVNWSRLVPKEVYDFVRKIRGEERVKILFEQSKLNSSNAGSSSNSNSNDKNNNLTKT
ncbi:MAG: nicotinamide-nucleotide adenylyltransferase [Conexivisphaerales archaeon]